MELFISKNCKVKKCNLQLRSIGDFAVAGCLECFRNCIFSLFIQIKFQINQNISQLIVY